MPSPKRIIPVSEVKPGDSITLGGIQGVLFVCDRWTVNDPETRTYINTINPFGAERAFTVDRDPDAPATVGVTNRKAKRLRGKMARRARLGVKPMESIG